MFCLLLMVCFHVSLSWAQKDTSNSISYQPSMGERAAAPPYLPDPPHPHRGGGGHHRHGSSNKELAKAIAHVADELHDLHDLMEDLVQGQQEANNMLTMLFFGGYNNGRRKRAVDDYQPPWEAYKMAPEPGYPTEPPPPPPTYDSPLPPSEDYFTPLSYTAQVKDYSTEDSIDTKPWRGYKGPRQVQFALPGQLPSATGRTEFEGSLPGYSDSDSLPGHDNDPTSNSGYPTHPPKTVSNYGEKPTPPPYNNGRRKRAIDDYQPPWEAYKMEPKPGYPTEPPPPPPTYDSPLPPSEDYFTPLSFTAQVKDYSTEDSIDRKPWRGYKGPRQVQFALPGQLPSATRTEFEGFLPGYSGSDSLPGHDNIPTSNSGYPTHPPRTVSNYGEKPTPPPGYNGRRKRAIDDYQPPWEAYKMEPEPGYPTEPPPPPPTYDSPLPTSEDYFTPLSLTAQVKDYSIEDSIDRKPWRGYNGPRQVQFALPGQLPSATRGTEFEGFLPGYSGSDSLPGHDNNPTSNSGYPTHPPKTVSNYGEPKDSESTSSTEGHMDELWVES